MRLKTKRVISWLLTMALLLSLVPVSVFPAAAAQTAQNAVITVQDVYASAGSTVNVNILIENNPGILGMTLKLRYDDTVATLIGVENGEALSYMSFTPPKGDALKNGCNLLWDAESVEPKDVKDGVIATLTFRIAEDAPENASSSITVTAVGDIMDNDAMPLDITMIPGALKIIDYIPGDVNEDGLITSTDVVYLRRYIAGGYGVSIREEAGDVNDDGVHTSTDVVYIRRYISDDCETNPDGYNITLKPSTPKCEHAMQAFAAEKETCTEDGNIAYWYCSVCENYYSDAEGTKKVALEDTVIAQTGHTPVLDPAVAPTYETTGLTEGSHCSVCNEVLVPQEEVPVLVKESYAITYNMAYNDSYLQSVEIENPNPASYASEDGLILEEPMVDGYVFEGWYDGQGTTANKVTEIPAGSTGEKKLYAHWSLVEYTVTFDSPLSKVDSVKYTVNTGATLTNPEWYGYTFVGWSDPYGKLISSLPVGTTGNVTLTANWTSKRNQTIPVTNLAEPGIFTDEETNSIFFVYEIGRVENVPLYTIRDFGYNSGDGITWSETVTVEESISEENAASIANTVSKATTTTSAWNLSKGWSETTSLSETQSSSTTKEQTQALEASFEKTGTWGIGSTVGGSSTVSAETGVSAKVSATYSAEMEAKGKLGVADVSAKAGYSVTGEVGGSYTETEEQSKEWNSSSSYESSSSAGMNKSVSSSLSSTVSKEFGYGKTWDSSQEFEESNELAVSSSEESEYGSTFVYSKGTTTTTTRTYSNEGATAGYYRLVAAGTVRVFAVVGYDIANKAYYVYTYSIMDDEVKDFMDYSATTSGFDDYENGILPFEVPFEVNTYVDRLTVTTKGLVVDIDTGMIVDYTGTADHVMIPEYMSVDNGDGTKTVVHIQGIESGAFDYDENIVEVKFPDTITSIPAGAFKGCTSLTGVIANSVTSIGDEAFSGCTSLENYTVGAEIKSLGTDVFTDVPSIVVYARTAAVAKAAAASGAKSITLNLSSLTDKLEDTTFTIPAGTEYFAFNGGTVTGGTNTYSGIRIVSDAAETMISGSVLTGCSDTPLVLSSEKVTLNRVSVESSGLVMQLAAETTNVALYGSVKLSSSASDAVHSNNLVMSLYNSGVSSKMNVTGNVLVCGTVTNEKYISMVSGEIICYNADETCLVTFDANGGTGTESTRVVSCGSAVGALPTAQNDGFVFYGWADADGNVLTADTILYTAGEMTVYAQWIEPYTISWNPGTGYTISVSRTASPNGGAATGTLSSGDSIYPGDVLKVTYTADTGYSLTGNGAEDITVSGNITAETIYATAEANTYTYNVVYKSSNGTALGSATVAYKFGTTNTVSPKAFTGYNAPATQSVTWDSTTAKTITFTYTPSAVAASQSVTGGTWWNNSGKVGIAYGVSAEYRNRTATSVQVRVVWTNTISAYHYFGFKQQFSGSAGGVSLGTVTIASASTWSSSSSSARSQTVYSSWVTVSLNTTNQTNVSLSGSWWDNCGLSGSWSGSIKVPAF